MGYFSIFVSDGFLHLPAQIFVNHRGRHILRHGHSKQNSCNSHGAIEQAHDKGSHKAEQQRPAPSDISRSPAQLDLPFIFQIDLLLAQLLLIFFSVTVPHVVPVPRDPCDCVRRERNAYGKDQRGIISISSFSPTAIMTTPAIK